MEEITPRELKLDNEAALLTFLKLTKEGKYAAIDSSSLCYTRIIEEREDLEEEYLYGIS